MPRISFFFGIVIRMYHDDHGYPHFHAQHADGHAKIRIDTLEPIEGNLQRRRFASCWPGPSSTKRSLKRTGIWPARVANLRTSSHCDERSRLRHHCC